MCRCRRTVLLFLPVVLACHFAAFHGLVTQSADAADRGSKKIVAGKPTYKAKSHEAWQDKGRVVGIVRDCPGCEVKALDAKTKKAVKSFAVKRGGKVYELQWLQPGEYILLVTADGYEALDVHGLVVKAKHDLHVNIEFEGQGP